MKTLIPSWCCITTFYVYTKTNRWNENLNKSPLAKMYWNMIWKSSIFVSLAANLAHFGPESGIPGRVTWSSDEYRAECGRYPICTGNWEHVIWVSVRRGNYFIVVRLKEKQCPSTNKRYIGRSNEVVGI